MPTHRGKTGRKTGKRARGRADVSPEKARKILHDGEIRGRPLTEKQRRMFGAIARGQ